MNTNYFEILEYNKVLEILSEYTKTFYPLKSQQRGCKMSSTVIRMRSESRTDLNYVSQAIISSSDMAGSELVLEQLSDANDATILLLVFEKFYFRNSSMTACTIQIVDDGQKQAAVIVGTGGGYGIFNISWGTNSNFACKAANSLAALGFSEI